MNILMITYSGDNESIPLVRKLIENQGGRVFRFDTDHFPTRDRVALGYGQGMAEQLVTTADGSIALDRIDAIWYRRMRIGACLPADMDPQLRAPSVEESRRTFLGMLASCDAFILDPFDNIRCSEVKQWQLKLARQLGMCVPNSLITNDPDAVRAFARANPAGIVTKMQASFAVYREGVEHVVFTNTLDEAALDDLEGLDLCPMTFQEKVPKQLELRVTVVGDRIFTAAVDSQVSDRALDDWRRDGQAFTEAWRPYDLPPAEAEKVLALMDRLKLNYGALDIILTPDGRYVFLEINPAGEWFWLDIYTGLPIARAIADVLMGKSYRRPTRLFGT